MKMSDTREILHCCVVEDVSENNALADELFSIENYDYNTLFDTETLETRHFLYFSDEKAAESAREFLSDPPEEWRSMGLKFAAISLTTVERKDWSEEWKKFFTIQRVSDEMVIKPTWLDYVAERKDEVVIELDPGMSFGTGKHATTRFCLRTLADLAKQTVAENPKTTLLDAGCGSGILTIGALKLGFTNITAFDMDPHSVKCAKENIEMNGFNPDSLDVVKMNLNEATQILESFDIVLANMLSHILIANKNALKTLVKPGGWLVAAGILTTEYDGFRGTFEEIGFREIRSESEDEWTGGLFKLQPRSGEQEI